MSAEQPEKNYRPAFACLILIISVLVVLCLISLTVFWIVRADKTPENDQTEATTADLPASGIPVSVELAQTPDAGTAYLDRMVFFGESTTSHLRARGVLTGGENTTQVWADQSGTKTLNSALLSQTIVYPETGENLTIPQAIAQKKPDFLVLSFGLNNITGFIENKASYLNNYKKLIRAVTEASPDTKILLQTVYPIGHNCTQWEDPAKINEYTITLNGWLCEIAAENDSVRVVDTASAVRGEDGFLLPSCAEADGYHLTRTGYENILLYLRTHAWN